MWKRSWILAAFFSVQSFAAGDWVLNEFPDRCTASTAAYFSDRTVYYLDVIVDKTGARPPEVMMRPKTSPSRVTAWRAPIDSNTSFSFAALPWSPGEVQFFWQAPRATSELISFLKRKNQFNVNAVAGASGQVPFSLRGSSATLNEMERKCGTLEETRFEAKFLPPEAQTFDVTLLTPDVTFALRELLAEGFAAYKNVLLVEKELEQLEARFAALTQELAALRAEIAQIGRDITTTENRKRAAQAEIDRATVEISSLRAQITAEQGRLATATADLRAAQAALQPYVAEHDRLLAAVSADRRRLADAQEDLRFADRRVQTANGRIADLERSLQFLRAQSDELERQVRRARIELAQAETERMAFNPEREIRQRKQNDARLIRLAQQIQQANQLIERRREAVRETKLDLDMAVKLLRECQGDCAALRRAVQEATQRHNQAKRDFEAARSQRDELVAQRERIENQIEAAVNREYDVLVQNETRARQRVAGLESNLEANDREMRNIVQIDLPSARSELNAATVARRSAAAAVDAAERALQASTSRYNQFKVSVGYDALRAEVTRTAGIVTRLRETIADLNARVAANERSIADQTALRDRMERRLVDLASTLSARQSREAQVIVALAPYEQEKAEIMTRLQAAEAVVAGISTRYGDTLP